MYILLIAATSIRLFSSDIVWTLCEFLPDSWPGGCWWRGPGPAKAGADQLCSAAASGTQRQDCVVHRLGLAGLGLYTANSQTEHTQQNTAGKHTRATLQHSGPHLWSGGLTVAGTPRSKWSQAQTVYRQQWGVLTPRPHPPPPAHSCSASAVFKEPPGSEGWLVREKVSQISRTIVTIWKRGVRCVGGAAHGHHHWSPHAPLHPSHASPH